MSFTIPPRLAYRVPEAAQALGLCRASIYNMITRGEIRTVKIGRSTLIPAAELERVVALPGGDAE